MLDYLHFLLLHLLLSRTCATVYDCDALWVPGPFNTTGDLFDTFFCSLPAHHTISGLEGTLKIILARPPSSSLPQTPLQDWCACRLPLYCVQNRMLKTGSFCFDIGWYPKTIRAGCFLFQSEGKTIKTWGEHSQVLRAQPIHLRKLEEVGEAERGAVVRWGFGERVVKSRHPCSPLGRGSIISLKVEAKGLQWPLGRLDACS